MKWNEYLQHKKSLSEFLLTLLILAAVLIFYTYYLEYNELRDGAVINDPVLSLLPIYNLNWTIFTLIYLPLLIAVIIFVKDPVKIIFAMQAYTALVIIRITAMYLLPLNPPEGMITLSDPFVEIFGKGEPFYKDLFFSGHTATLFLFFLIEDKKIFKILFLTAAIFVAAALMLQHVHYSIDIFAAFFFTYCAFRITVYFRSKVNSY